MGPARRRRGCSHLATAQEGRTGSSGLRDDPIGTGPVGDEPLEDGAQDDFLPLQQPRPPPEVLAEPLDLRQGTLRFSHGHGRSCRRLLSHHMGRDLHLARELVGLLEGGSGLAVGARDYKAGLSSCLRDDPLRPQLTDSLARHVSIVASNPTVRVDASAVPASPRVHVARSNTKPS